MGLFKLIATLVAGLLWTAWAYFVLREKNINPFRDVLDGFSRLRWLNKVAILFIVVQLTMFGGAKHGGTNDVDGVNGTNDVQQVSGTNDVGEVDWTNGVDGVSWTNDFGGADGGASGTSGNGQPMLMMLGGVPPSLSDDEQECGDAVPVQSYRLDGVTTNANISYEMPSDAMVRGCWHLRGAYEDVFRLDLGTFRFPLGNELLSSLWVYTWGKVRPHLAAVSNDVRVTGVPMSAIPGVSRLWSRAGTNSFLLTWEDFVIGRHSVSNDLPPELVSAQLELHPTGDFIARSNEVEWVYHRVVPPNPITPVNPEDPLHPGVSIHPYGPAQDLSVIEEANAYCWVDIVVERADSWVRFEGDGFSNLSDPSFAAKAGETNRVVILIGKTYKVSCDMPFRVIDKSSEAIDEWWEDSQTLWLNWPVDIWAQGDNEDRPLLLMGTGNGMSGGSGFTMHVNPNCLGGEFSWTNSCCAVYGGGLHFTYGCDGFCLCGGCSARGCYCYEGYRIGCYGGSCGCSWYDDDDRHGEDDPDDPDPSPSVSVSFSKRAVIFEDAYTNMPDQLVERQSTTVTLNCVVHGGMKGGTATFTFTGRDKLEGPDIPESIIVPAGHCKTYEFTYRGKLPSGSEEDITIHGEFVENNPETGSSSLVSDDEMTSIKVELMSVDTAVANPDRRRHVYGIAEEVQYRTFPTEATVSWSFPAGLLYWNSTSFCCPWSSADMSSSGSQIRVAAYGVSYDIGIMVLDPIIQAQNPRVNVDATDVSPVLGEAGHLLLYLDLYATPYYVSFRGIQIREVADESQGSPHTGYYDDRAKGGNWSHTSSDGAGVWHTVGQSGFFASDKAGRRTAYQEPWIYGWKEWAIPMEWGAENNTSVSFNPNPTTQRFTLEANGNFKIRKFNHEAERNILGLKWLDGELVW